MFRVIHSRFDGLGEDITILKEGSFEECWDYFLSEANQYPDWMVHICLEDKLSSVIIRDHNPTIYENGIGRDDIYIEEI